MQFSRRYREVSKHQCLIAQVIAKLQEQGWIILSSEGRVTTLIRPDQPKDSIAILRGRLTQGIA